MEEKRTFTNTEILDRIVKQYTDIIRDLKIQQLVILGKAEAYQIMLDNINRMRECKQS